MRVMHAIADENFQLPVIERHRNVNGDFLVGIPHEAIEPFFQTQLLAAIFKARFGRFVNVEFVVRRLQVT